MSEKAEATTTRGAEPLRQPWLCTCGTPSLPSVLHRADRPCAAVRDEGAE